MQHGGTQEPIHQIAIFINTYACIHALHRPCLCDQYMKPKVKLKIKLKKRPGLSSGLIVLKSKEQIKFSKFLFLENNLTAECSRKEGTSKSTHNKRTGK